MIVNQYERPAGRAEPKVSDPLLQELDGKLDDPRLLGLVRRDLKQHYSRWRRGRPAVPVEVTLRACPAWHQRSACHTVIGFVNRIEFGMRTVLPSLSRTV